MQAAANSIYSGVTAKAAVSSREEASTLIAHRPALEDTG